MNQKEFTVFGAVFVLLLILALVFISFRPVLGNGFVNWDTYTNLIENPTVRSLDLRKIFTDVPMKTYIPLTILSWALEYHFAGLEPFIYHLNNLLLHLGIVTLVFLFSRQCGLPLQAAGLAALIFGLHPMHVEPVAWVTGRKDLLYAFLYMAAVCSYMNYIGRNRTRYYVLTLFLGLLSLLAKPMAASLPLILCLCDWFKGRSFSWKVVLEKIVFLLYIAPVGLYTYSYYEHYPVKNIVSSMLIWISSATFYIKQFFFPFYLSAFYTLDKPVSITNPHYALAAGIFIFCLWSFFQFKKVKYYRFALLFYFFSVCFLLRFREVLFDTTTFAADRYMYLASAGFCVFLGHALSRLMEKSKEKGLFFHIMLSSLTVTLVCVLSAQSYQRCFLWKDSVTFWSAIIAQKPNVAANPYNNRGEAYFQTGRYDLAAADFLKATTIYPDYAVAFTNLGSAYAKQGKHLLALDALNTSVRISPGRPMTFYTRSLVYRDLKDYPRALTDARKAQSLGAKVHPEYIQGLQ